MKGNLVNTVEATFLASTAEHFVRMFILMISSPSLNMGNAGSKTRSIGQIAIKSCKYWRSHLWLQQLVKIGVRMISRSSSNMGHIGLETRLLGRNEGKSC